MYLLPRRFECYDSLAQITVSRSNCTLPWAWLANLRYPDRFECKEGLLSKHQLFVFKGEVLEDRKTLAQYNINYGALIHFICTLG